MMTRISMMTLYGLVFLVFLTSGCESLTFFRTQALESDIQTEFQDAALLLKKQEYQKAVQAYLHIHREYPQDPRAEEAQILGQELQKLISLIQSLAASKESALKDLSEIKQMFQQLSDRNAELEAFNTRMRSENIRLRSELRQVEARLTGLEEENRRFRSNIDRLKESLKEFHEIEQEIRPPIKPPTRSEGVEP